MGVVEITRTISVMVIMHRQRAGRLNRFPRYPEFLRAGLHILEHEFGCRRVTLSFWEESPVIALDVS